MHHWPHISLPRLLTCQDEALPASRDKSGHGEVAFRNREFCDGQLFLARAAIRSSKFTDVDFDPPPCRCSAAHRYVPELRLSLGTRLGIAGMVQVAIVDPISTTSERPKQAIMLVVCTIAHGLCNGL